ncbi:Hypothetical protein A7982_10317 [Minicystis rosea]|nr:Hypothetical protein A7982_10317 [Minicystis rosea]
MLISPVVRGLFSRSFILVASALLASCAGHAGPVRALSAEARAVLQRAPLVYGPPDAPRTAPSERLRAAFESGLSKEMSAVLRHEPALDMVASVMAETYDEHEGRPSHAVTQWLFWKSGATSQFSHAHTAWASRTNAVERLDAKALEFAQKLTVTKPRTYGVARITYGRKTTQAIVIGTAPLVVTTLPKAYAPGAPFTLQIRPLDASPGFVLLADTESGDVAEEKLTQRDDGSFFVSRAVPARPGRYFIEVRATRPSATGVAEVPWERPVLWLPIYVGAPEPADPDPAMTSPLPSPTDPTAWPAWITAQYDAERARRGKAPITPHPVLAEVARDRSRAFAVSSGEAALERNFDKLTALGLTPKKLQEHHEPFESVSDYVVLRLLHPSGRKLVLMPDHLLLGIGITPRERPTHGRTEYDAIEQVALP